MPSNHSKFQFCHSNIGLFSIPCCKVITLNPLSWKSDNYMESNIEKKPWTNLQKNLSKEIKSDNFCYRKNGRAITKWGAIEKSNKRVTKIISHYDGSNNIFVDCSVVMPQKWFLLFQMILAIYLIKNIHIHVQYMYNICTY